jgi:hypothetical protein
MNDQVIVIPDDEGEFRDARDELIEGDLDSDVLPAAPSKDGLPQGAVVQGDGSVKLKLLYPVTLRWKKGETITEDVISELHLHRLTGEHMMRIGNSGEDGSKAIVTLGCSTRLPHSRVDAIFKRMDAADVTASSEVLGFLLRGGRRTGR